MAWGVKMAYVLRAKGGRNLLIKTNGLPGEAVHDAGTSAVTLLAKFAAAQGRQIQDGSGDSPPAFALGRVTVSQGRYNVTYRMVNTVLVMVVSEPGANPFTCLHAVDAATKVLLNVCRGVEVTAERIIKKYIDVYTMLGDLLEGGLDALQPAFIHVSATDEKLMALPKSTSDAARRVRRMMGAGARSSTFTAEGDPNALPPVPETPTRSDERAADSEASDPMADVAFEIPMDALPPPPARAMGARRRPPPPAAPVAVVPPPAYKGAVTEDELQQSAQEGFGAFQEPELMEAEKATVAAADEDMVEVGSTAGAAAAPTGPVVTAADAQESLMLVEFWRAEGRGNRILKAGIEGTVRRRLAPYGLQRVRFRVLPSETKVVNVCLGVAGVNKDSALQEQGRTDGSFLAALAGAPMNCSYLKYSLPAVACPAPLQAELLVAPPKTAPRGLSERWQCLVAIPYVASPALSGALLDVTFDVQLPPEVSEISKVSPAGQWSKDQGRLRWMVPRIEGGQSGVVRAVLKAKDGVSAQRAEESMSQVATARVTFTGWPGRAPSGLGFEVAIASGGSGGAETEHKFNVGKIVWFGDIVLRPA